MRDEKIEKLYERLEEVWKGKNIYVKDGEKIHNWFHLRKTGKFRVQFENCVVDSVRKQGVALFFSEGFKGKVFFDGEPLKIPKSKFGHYIFEKNDSSVIVSCPIDADIKNGHLIFGNASNEPDENDTELFRCGSLGREFWIEILAENVYRFHCNDNFCSFSERTYTHFVFDMVVTDME